MRVVYFGTPAFAAPTLEALARDSRFDVRLVVTQPDRPAGRGRKLESSAVAATARALGLPLYQPASLRTAEAREPLAEAEADLFVVAAFGLIFGKATLALPRLACLNLHGSLLPSYRGASPVQAAILAGDAVTGITLMKMDAGLDTGDAIATIEEPILTDDTTESLMARLAAAGAKLALEAIPAYAAGDLAPVPQPSHGATVTRTIAKADGWIDWTDSATAIERRVRAMWPWPRAWTTFDGAPLQIHRGSVNTAPPEAVPGTLQKRDGGLVVACGADALRLEVVQPAGRSAMSGAAFVSGRRIDAGVLGVEGAPEPMPTLVGPARQG